jgi:phospholipid/cholesterol/gamma-HCH transport system permease protein
MTGRWLAVPGELVASLGEIVKFCGQVFGDILNARVFHFFGEAMRQAGILILGSALVIWGMVFILGLECGIEGAYFTRAQGAPAYAGVFSAWCDLREMVPYMFGYIMSAKVGTGIVAELGAMRINEEIDALEVIGLRPITFLAATRILAAWMVLPFIYMAAVGVGFFASYLAVVEQVGEVLLLRLHRLGRTGGGRPGDRQVDDPEHGARAPDRRHGKPALLGRKPKGADRRVSQVRG